MICPGDGQAIGFVKLARTAAAGEYEIVYAIGEESLWGQGYGKTAIGKALTFAFAFADLQAVSVIAKINPENTRSRRLAAACGFREVGLSGEMTLFQAKCG